MLYRGISTRDFLDRILEEREKFLNERFAAQKEALGLAREDIERRLDKLSGEEMIRRIRSLEAFENKVEGRIVGIMVITAVLSGLLGAIFVAIIHPLFGKGG